jgi:H+/Cl- antiporter ClcA
LAAEPDQNIAQAIAEVSEHVSALVRDEIALAKAEVTQKITKLAKGIVVGIAAGIFVLGALVFILDGTAWLLYYVFPIGNNREFFWGFYFLALILLVLAGLAGYLAFRFVRAGAPPTPKMAIDEARKIRETVSSVDSS